MGEKSAWEHQIPKKKVGRPLKKVAHSEPDDVNVKETPEDPVPAALAPKGRGRPRKDDAAKIEPTNTVGAKRKQGPGAPKGKKKAKPPLSETESESSIDLDSLVLPEIPLGIVTRSGRVPPQIEAMKGNMKNDPKKLDFKTKDDTLKNDPTKVNATAKEVHPMANNQHKVNKNLLNERDEYKPTAQDKDRVETNQIDYRKEDLTDDSEDNDTEGCNEWTIANQVCFAKSKRDDVDTLMITHLK
ncbi:hypothetical protein MJO29_011263 [Puccinia striiformis f. sp. tritici]|nr:hypothetical protein MJO29_011263 [Puccinia striiformis f. sp. tritici]